MQLQRLERVVSEIGHPRGHLIKYLGTPEIEAHTKQCSSWKSTKVTTLANNLRARESNIYLVATDIESVQEILVRYNGTVVGGGVAFKYIDEYARRHIISSSIKNLIIKPSDVSALCVEFNEDADAIRINAMMYLYYYFAIFGDWVDSKTPTEKEIIEGVCLLLQETISTLIAKSNTLYKGIELDPSLDLLQMRLRLERLSLDSSDERVFNLREFL